jgi:hypothetical protein
MNKTVKTILCTLCCVLALYGLILLIRKIMLSPDSPRMTKKDLGYSFYLEPFRQSMSMLDYEKDDIKKLEEKLRKNEYRNYSNSDREREMDEKKLAYKKERVKLRSNVNEECLKNCKEPGIGGGFICLRKCQKK